MIPNGTAYSNYPPFANNGSKTPPGGSTESAKYALGMVPSDTFPAEWANYLFHGATNGITRLNADTGSIKKELNNVLSEASITPDAQVNTQLFMAIKALANLTRTIISLSTSASERPAKSDVPFIPSVQDGLRISVKFTNGYYDAATNGFSFNLNNQGAKKIYAVKHGVLTEMRYHELTRDRVQRKWYVQPLTTLDLIYDATLDSGAGGWIVEGNPVVLSSSDYTIYANGKIGDEVTGSVKIWTSANPPYGWLICNGSLYNKTAYTDLFSVIGTTYNISGDESTKFRVPDYRECALVGVGTNSVRLNSATLTTHDTYTLGQFKDDALQNHTGQIKMYTEGTGSTGNASASGVFKLGSASSIKSGGDNYRTSASEINFNFNNTGVRTASITRGKRIGVNYIIKY